MREDTSATSTNTPGSQSPEPPFAPVSLPGSPSYILDQVKYPALLALVAAAIYVGFKR
jgi:hypothetical protein